MKTKLTLLAISSSLVLAAPALLAQDTNTNGTNSPPPHPNRGNTKKRLKMTGLWANDASFHPGSRKS
jgi:hypothetical protein